MERTQLLSTNVHQPPIFKHVAPVPSWPQSLPVSIFVDHIDSEEGERRRVKEQNFGIHCFNFSLLFPMLGKGGASKFYPLIFLNLIDYSTMIQKFCLYTVMNLMKTLRTYFS